MTAEPTLPWREYSREKRLPKGWSHVVSRDVVANGLREHNVVVDHLSFGQPYTAGDSTWSMVFDFYWVGDGRSRIFEGPKGEALPGGRLLMRWQAVPSEQRATLAHQVVDGWLHDACAWAAAIEHRGNAWSATDHRWVLARHDDGLREHID